MANLTLIADAKTLAGAATGLEVTPFQVRPSTAADLEPIASLYFRSYTPGVGCATEAEAIADVAASYDGDYGEYLHSASPVVVSGAAVVAAVMTVQKAPWADTPACLFVIELFTDPDYRRKGFATALLAAAANAIIPIDSSMALRVEQQNASALAVYDRLGFRRWQSSARP